MPPFRALAWLVSSLIVVSAASARAEDFYVAVDGDDDNTGTIDEPFATIERGQEAASAGDTVFIRGGVYEFSGTTKTIGVELTKSGSSGAPIKYFAYPGEQPILDLFDLLPNARVTGIDVRANWIHIRGLEVRGVQQIVVGDSWGVRIRGDSNVIEHLNVHDNEAPGIFITSGASNLILNCDSHHNYDPLEDGGNADGFGCHSTGSGNVLRGCRAWENSDDGYDFINAAGACRVEESWAMRNGWVPDTNQAAANGAGFKSGGYGNPPNTPGGGAARHEVRFCVAFDNRVVGFYANYHPGPLVFLNNTAFDNPSNFDLRPPTGAPMSPHTLRNNIAGPGGNATANWSGDTDEFNSWTLPVTVGSDDFLSLDTSLAYAAREADGSLPATMLARLREGSDLIDKGEELGFDFAGDAPDLGAFEYGLVPVEPEDAGVGDASVEVDAGMSGGAGGAAGTISSGGAGGAGGAGVVGGAGGAATGGMSGGMQPGSGGAGGTGGAGAAGMNAPQGGDGAASKNGGGCGCRVAGERASSSAPLALLLGALLVLRARARRRGSKRALAVTFCLAMIGCSDDPETAMPMGGQAATSSGGNGGMTAGGGGTSSGGTGAAGAGGLGGTSGAGGAATGGMSASTGGSGGNGGSDGAVPDDRDASAGSDADIPSDDKAIWIATDGVDTNPGTEAMPLANLAAALERAMPGWTIWVKPGTYAGTETVRFTVIGTEAQPVNVFAAPGARPIFDFDAQPKGDSAARGFQISGSYVHLRGFDVINAGDNCIHISGSYNTIERVDTYGCSDTGIQITANSSEAGDASRAAHNTVVNCDSHDNYDEANQGENADGFAAKLYIGPGNVFRGCRAWNNADDGWDFFASDDVVVVDDCWAIANGKIGPAQNNTNGDGNGFKLGGAARAGDANMGGAVHVVTRSISIENRACGFVRNNNTVEPELSMCGGRGDGKGLLCSLSNDGAVTVDTTAAEAIAAGRDADGNLPALP